jgi:HEAT repeat protein
VARNGQTSVVHLDIPDSHIIEDGRIEGEPPHDRDQLTELSNTTPSSTDPMILADGVDHIRIAQEDDSTYFVQYFGFVAGYARVDETGIEEFGRNYLADEEGVPDWFINGYTEDRFELPRWVPESYDPKASVECVRCHTAVPPTKIMTPGRAADDSNVVDWFCPDCWEVVSEHWSPEWIHAGKPDIYRAEYLDRTVGGNPTDADVGELVELSRSSEEKAQMHALTAMGRLIPDRSKDIVSVCPVLVEHLESEVLLTRFGALSCLSLLAEDDPEHVLSVIDHVLPLLEPACDPGIHEESIRFVSEVSTEYPEHVQDAVPQLATLLNDDPPQEQALLEAIVNIAKTAPDAVVPIAEDLCAYVESDEATHRTSAIAALGYIAKEAPEAAETTIPTMMALLESTQDRLRANAAGLLADLSEAYPEQMTYELSQVVALVEDPNENAQHNATYILAKVASRYPDDVEPAIEPLIQALDADLKNTRISACRALGYVGAEEATDALETRRDNDPSQDVRKVAGWALGQIPLQE